MSKIVLSFLFMVLSFLTVVNAQNDDKYAKQIETILDFKQVTLKDTVYFSSTIKAVSYTHLTLPTKA